MTDEWTEVRVRVSGVEELMLEDEGVVYRDDAVFAGCALAAFTERDRFAARVDAAADKYDDWVVFEIRDADGIWQVDHDGDRVGANRNLDEALSHACSLPTVDLNPWHPAE